MSWQDIILTPLFWMVATTGTVVLSITANLLTPFVSAFVTRHLHARQSGVRKKQIQRRDQVLILQANLSRRTGAKLDAIFKLLLALVLMVVCVFLFQLGSGSLQISAPSTPSMQLQLPTLLIILLGRSLPSLSVSWDWMIWRLHSQPTAANVQAMIFSSNTLRRAPRKGSILRTTGICVSLE